MNEEIITKNKNDLKPTPNITDYKDTYQNFNWQQAKKNIVYFPDGKLNAAYCAIDCHLKTEVSEKKALLWEGDNGKTTEYTYKELAKLSNKFANYLKTLGIGESDRVFIFLPRVPELYTSFLGILKTGAIAGTLFSAFGAQALKDRLENSQAKILVTNKELETRVLEVKKDLPALEKIILVDGEEYQRQMREASEEFEIFHAEESDPAFMLYTSGTTGKPKGVVHCHKAIIQQNATARWVLDLHENDIYWCTADPGWVTGVAYTILGPWSCGVTSVVYGGRFDAETWYRILEKYKVSVWYTAPTAIRMLQRDDDLLVKKFNLSSLRHMCSVGEPLNPEAIRWGEKAFGLAFHDNWWQTETGAICIANYRAENIKLGSMGQPVPGITAGIVDDEGKSIPDNTEGNLALKPGWPSMMKEIWQNEEKFKSYFVASTTKVASSASDASFANGWPASNASRSDAGWYITGDRAYRDNDGYFWFIGRADDVIKTSGERVGPFEVESALVEHPAVIEAGVIGKPDALRGEIIKAFLVLRNGHAPSEQLKENIVEFVKKHLAGHAYPREIEFVQSLPKTRSGKILRRMLKAKELGQPIGDTSTLEEY